MSTVRSELQRLDQKLKAAISELDLSRAGACKADLQVLDKTYKDLAQIRDSLAEITEKYVPLVIAPTEPELIELSTAPNLPMPKGWMGELEKDALLVRVEMIYRLREDLKAEKEAAEREAERLRLDEL